MEYNINKKQIKLDRNLNELDNFVIDFCSILDKYVLVSGYVSILFGRSRATEDVDLLIPPLAKEEFSLLWKKIEKSGFECLNTSKIDEALDILKESAIRFARKNKPLPNMEFKIMKNDIERYSYENKLKVILKLGEIFISPLEMQIAYKLFLGRKGNEKDIEDAKHIYNLFLEKINKKELIRLINELNVEKEFELIK